MRIPFDLKPLKHFPFSLDARIVIFLILLLPLIGTAQVSIVAEKFDYGKRAFDITLQNQGDSTVILTQVGADFVELPGISLPGSSLDFIKLKTSASYQLPLFKDTVINVIPMLTIRNGESIRIEVGFTGWVEPHSEFSVDVSVSLNFNNGEILKTHYWMIRGSDFFKLKIPPKKDIRLEDKGAALRNLRFYPEWDRDSVLALVQDAWKSSGWTKWYEATELIAIFQLEELFDSLKAIPITRKKLSFSSFFAVRSMCQILPDSTDEFVRAYLTKELKSDVIPIHNSDHPPIIRGNPLVYSKPTEDSHALAVIRAMTAYRPKQAEQLFLDLVSTKLPIVPSPEPTPSTMCLAALCRELIFLQSEQGISLLVEILDSDDNYLAEKVARGLDLRFFNSRRFQIRRDRRDNTYAQLLVDSLIERTRNSEGTKRLQILKVIYYLSNEVYQMRAEPIILDLLTDDDLEIRNKNVINVRRLNSFSPTAIDTLIYNLTKGLNVGDQYYPILASIFTSTEEKDSVLRKVRIALEASLSLMEDTQPTREQVMGMATLGMALIKAEDDEGIPLVKELFQKNPQDLIADNLLSEVVSKHSKYKRKTPSYIPHLKEVYPTLLHHQKNKVRRDALIATCLSYDEKDFLISILETALKDSEAMVRMEASYWVGKKKYQTLVPKLKKLYRSSDSDKEKSKYCKALEALGQPCED